MTTAGQINERHDGIEPERPPELSVQARNIAFSLIAGGMLLAALDGTIVSTALPTIVGDLGGGEHMTWVVTSYLLTQTIATVLFGKFGDLFGRKTMFVLSIVIFIAASALCGMSESMVWLIAMRALQGIGGGGLSVTATAMIADIIPLRQRGTYQGAIGAVFGVATVLGPLAGGLLTDNLSWRWVFYVNVPIALVILPLAVRLLPSTRAQAKPVIDYPGIAFVSAGAACLILATSWGGTQYAWNSGVIIGLFVAAALLIAGFVAVEARTESPVLPLRLFRGNVFTVCSVLSFIVGFALLGSMTFLPTYLQYGQGVSATNSGVRMFPMVLGLLIASVSAGTVVSRTGVYRIFPIVGSLIMATGMWLLSMLDATSSVLRTSASMFVFGVGIGLSMQVLTIVVQNTAEYRDLGVATSGVSFFRAMGQSFGSAVFGAIYANQLGSSLRQAVLTTGADPARTTTPEAVHQLPPAQHVAVVAAYVETIQTVFRYCIPVALLALLVALLLKQVPLRGLTRSGATDVGRGFAMPDERSSAEQLECQVARAMTRLPDVADDLRERSGLDSVQTWVVRMVAIYQRRNEGIALAEDIAHRRGMPVAVIEPALADAQAAGLIEHRGAGYALTAHGVAALKVVIARLVDFLQAQVEQERGEPLADTAVADLGRIASRLALHEVRSAQDARRSRIGPASRTGSTAAPPGLSGRSSSASSRGSGRRRCR